MTLPDDDPPDEGKKEKDPKSSVQKLERIIEAVPEPKRDEFREIIREFMGIVHSKTSSPFDIDPEVAKVIFETQVKDNQNKFEFATIRQKDNHEYRMITHRDRTSIIRPLVFIITVTMVVSLFIGMWFAYKGYDLLGGCIMTAVITAVLGYLAGVGTSDLVRPRKD